jgi:hypothetical protein
MAEMEAMISNPGLIKSLERNRTALNSAFDYYSAGTGRIESADIFKVFARIMNPLYDSGMTVSDKILMSIFRCVLNLISKKMAGAKARDNELEKLLYIAAEKHKNLLAEHGGIFLINVLNALLNLSAKKNVSAEEWTSLISALPEVITMEEFRRYGFIAAWICGAASAGETAAGLIKNSDPEIIKKIFKADDSENINTADIAEAIIKDPWRNPLPAINKNKDSSPVFKTAGGFRGYGYEFKSLPVVVCTDDCFYAADGVEVFRLYGDYFGIELIREKNISPGIIKPGGVINRFVKDNNFIYENKNYLLPADWKTGVTSIAFNKNTVVWTLNDSYKLYIAGIRNNA